MHVAQTEVLANLDLQTKDTVVCALLVLCLHTVCKVKKEYSKFAPSLLIPSQDKTEA